ncbi:MAG: S24/S26 family peptidase [Puniceicoccales bacterium]
MDSQAPQVTPSSTLPASSTSRAARSVEDGAPDRISGPGSGESMEPLMGRNSYLVIDPIAFEDLRSGMIVAYRNLAGRRVVHRIVEKDGPYWTVEGINNPHEDADFVTRDNLIGVVYGTFHGAN